MRTELPFSDQAMYQDAPPRILKCNGDREVAQRASAHPRVIRSAVENLCKRILILILHVPGNSRQDIMPLRRRPAYCNEPVGRLRSRLA
jgi:hypothetical protein